MRSDFEIVFQFGAIAVISDIDSGINLLCTHALVQGDVGAPVSGLIADEIVDFRGERIGPLKEGMSVGVEQVEAEDSAEIRFAVSQGKLDGRGFDGEDIIGAASDVGKTSGIRFKTERQQGLEVRGANVAFIVADGAVVEFGGQSGKRTNQQQRET